MVSLIDKDNYTAYLIHNQEIPHFMANSKMLWYVMAAMGFILLLLNAFSYIFDWDSKSSAFTILGLVFVTIGLKNARDNRK